MNSKTAQLRENRDRDCPSVRTVCARSFLLSAVADRFGLWGPYGAKNVSWGNFAHFVEYTGAGDVSFPQFIGRCRLHGQLPSQEDTLVGYCSSQASKYEGLRPLRSSPFVICYGMVTGLGIKTPFDYSVFSAAAAAFLLAFWEPDRFTLDKLLNRLRN